MVISRIGTVSTWLGAVVLLACGCGTASDLSTAHTVRLASPQFTAAGTKVVTGPPIGIYVTWTRVDEAVSYYLYRDTESIPDPNPDGNIDPALRVNGGNPIPQPAEGSTITFSDLFAPVVGQTYYYRVTAVDAADQEGYASGEMSWTVAGHTVAGFAPAAVYWGDVVTITGDTFGDYEPLTDSVMFAAIGGGQVAGTIVQPTDWTPTQIVVTVPENCVTGKLFVVVNGVIAASDEDLVVLQPYINGLLPEVGFVQQELLIAGGNFGATQGLSNITINSADATGAVTSWSDSEIRLDVPAATTAGDVVVSVEGRSSNAVPFTPRAEITACSELSTQVGEPLTLSGRFFGATSSRVLIDGAVEQLISDWQDTTISLIVSGDVGNHQLTVETSAGIISNEWAFSIVDPLAVTLGGLDPFEVYRPFSPTLLGITTAADTAGLDLIIDGSDYSSGLAPPFDAIELPAGALTNGQHTVQVRAHRRAVSALSEEITVTVYSLIGDINGDGVIDASDRDALLPLIGLSSADPGYTPWYDTNNDGEVNEADLTVVGYFFGGTIE